MWLTTFGAGSSVAYGLITGDVGFVTVGMGVLSAPQLLRFGLSVRGTAVKVEASS